MDFSQFDGRVVSVLIEGKGNKKEAYIGKLSSHSDFICIEPNNPQFDLEQVWIRADTVLSLWLFKKG